MGRPETKFVHVGRDRVASVVWGDGPTDVLFLAHFGASVDSIWEHPGHLRWTRSLGAHLRVIMLDHRGSGMSDSVPDARQGNLDDRIDDILAALDAAGTGRVSLCAEGDGALTAIKFAVEHPERVAKLVLLNGYAAGSAVTHFLDDTPTSAEQLDELADSVRSVWGSGRLVAAVVPHFGDDLEFCAWYERMGARPSVAAALVRNLAVTDVRPLLAKMTAPTLVIYSGDITLSSIEQSRELAERIPGARLFEGSSSTFYWGSGVIDELLAFITGAAGVSDRDLVTLLFTDIVDSTGAVVAAGDDEWRQTLDFLDDLVASRVGRAGGRVVKQTGDGHLIEFAAWPGDAVNAAVAMCHAAPALGVKLRAGIHSGEIERRENGDIGGLTVHIAARVAATADPGQVIISRTVADLLGAGGQGLRDFGEHELKGVPGRWALFVVDP